ncbi:metalloregulator ArsR/SmtB family transcription factor [Dactylosporangium sp. NPDC051485]|uniref:ArsR/SmtB family transcription factor n=1 Tax=Dactylosporangium sp. NPDC051485 TaxID=3154846 RepID=UPI00342B4AFA
MSNPRGGQSTDISAEVLQSAAATFGILAATVRLHIVWLLAAGERDVSTLADEVGATVQVVSQHLAKLRLAGLVQARREGRRQLYLINDPHLVAVVREMVAHLRGPAAHQGAQHGLGG